MCPLINGQLCQVIPGTRIAHLMGFLAASFPNFPKEVILTCYLHKEQQLSLCHSKWNKLGTSPKNVVSMPHVLRQGILGRWSYSAALIEGWNSALLDTEIGPPRCFIYHPLFATTSMRARRCLGCKKRGRCFLPNLIITGSDRCVKFQLSNSR